MIDAKSDGPDGVCVLADPEQCWGSVETRNDGRILCDEHSRRYITLEQVLAWIPEWSTTDLRRIQEWVDSRGAGTFYIPGNRAYIGCRRAGAPREESNLFYVNPGFLEPATKDGGEWEALSTFRDRSDASSLPQADVCGQCGLQLPLTGICDDCDDS